MFPKKLSISSTIQEELADMRQRMQCISIWEAGLFARADSVKTREEAISAQEVKRSRVCQDQN